MSVPAVRADDGALSLLDEPTGELVPLELASTDLVAASLRVIEVRLYDLYDLKRQLGASMIARMDRRASWTHRAAGVEVTAPSPDAGKDGWDATILVPILDALVADGVIDREASLAACEPRTEWKPLVRGINALLKIDGVAERLSPARVPAVPKPRTVKVNVKRGAEE